MRRCFLAAVVLLILAIPNGFVAQLAAQAPAPAVAAERITLPEPNRAGGMTLTEALAKRRSVRSFAPTKLTQAELSQLLWAAQGVTDDKGHRTAPSARAAYYLHLYLATADGFFEYVPAGHQLQKLSGRDLRPSLSPQRTVTDAPAVFLIAGDYPRATQGGGAETGLRWVHLEAGHAAQNLLLQATALGLGAVPVGGIQPQPMQEAAALPASSTPIYLVPVGHVK
jgi:SagB-type dehydrogenase family enzyme